MISTSPVSGDADRGGLGATVLTPEPLPAGGLDRALPDKGGVRRVA
ncbi:hypothetical protein GCM10027075_14790 [Streptomyces heilongjiangensis]